MSVVVSERACGQLGRCSEEQAADTEVQTPLDEHRHREQQAKLAETPPEGRTRVAPVLR